MNVLHLALASTMLITVADNRPPSFDSAMQCSFQSAEFYALNSDEAPDALAQLAARACAPLWDKVGDEAAASSKSPIEPWRAATIYQEASYHRLTEYIINLRVARNLQKTAPPRPSPAPSKPADTPT